MGYAQRACLVICCEGTDAGAERIKKVGVKSTIDSF